MPAKRQRSDSAAAAAAAATIVTRKASRQKTKQKRSSAAEPDDSSSVVAELEAATLDLLRSRNPGTNCCPSEVPRRLLGEKSGDWRRLMPAVREAAARLVERGELEITQRGVAVSDPRDLRGPIRLRLVVR